MATRITNFIEKNKIAVLVFWAAFALLTFFLAPALSDVADFSSQSFLPENSASKRAEALLSTITGPRSGLSSLALVINRESGLRDSDHVLAQELIAKIQGMESELGISSFMHPWLSNDHRKQLIDPSNRTALAAIGLDGTSWAPDMADKVTALREAVAQLRAEQGVADDSELNIYVTGEAAFSADERQLVVKSMDVITGITIAVVLIILMLVFRSPLAPLLPLAVIGLSFLISRGLIAWVNLLGLAVSAYTETFLIAVLFGAGTDYCMFLIGRYKDELAAGKNHTDALHIAWRWSAGSILSSGFTTLVGFLCMGFAVFGLYNSTGPAVAIGVFVTILLVLTLTPALLSLFGPKVFWPMIPGQPVSSRLQKLLKHQLAEKFWPSVASKIRRRPGLILILVLAAYTPAAVSSVFMERSFDQVAEISTSVGSRAGFELVNRDFGHGVMMPVKVAIFSQRDIWDMRSLALLEKLSAKLEGLDGVALVRGPTRPTGTRLDRMPGPDGVEPDPARFTENFLLPRFVINSNPLLKGAMETFIDPAGNAVYLEVMLAQAPYTLDSLDLVDVLRDETSMFLQEGWLEGAQVEVGGPSAMFQDLRVLTGRDFALVVVLVLSGIFIILVFMLRSIVAPLFLIASIFLSFMTTLGISTFVFQHLFGYEGVNWAVQFFSFCVLTALGVDYNIFLMGRVQEEYRPGDVSGAVERALVGTGKLITSCGLIMAGCFFAMMVSPLRSIREVGFAVVVGMLLDTFVIRSFLVPSIATLLGEKIWWPFRRDKKEQRVETTLQNSKE